MDIKQVFKSISDGQTISELEMGGANPAAPIPVAGDTVHWTASGKAYTAHVQSRLISYSTTHMNVGRDDDVDITITLTVDVSH